MAKQQSQGGSSLPLHFSGEKFSKAIVAWYSKNSVAHPWRRDWLQFSNPYHVWVSEIMLQQTLISVVTPIYMNFIERFPTLGDLAAASDAEVREAVRGLGYYRRFRMLHVAAKQLTEGAERSGIYWPTSFSGWMALPGVGEYTAAAVGSIAFNLPVPVVDGNVERVLCRLFDLRVAPNLPALKRQFFRTFEPLVCRKRPGDFNQGLMELGQLVCTSLNPTCQRCPVRSLCLSYKNQSQKVAPGPKIRKENTEVALELLVVAKRNKIGLVPRPQAAKFLKGTSGFPTFIRTGSKIRGDGFDGAMDYADLQKIGTIRHHITNHSIRADIYFSKANGDLPGLGSVEWIPRPEVERNLLANLDRKAWILLERELRT